MKLLDGVDLNSQRAQHMGDGSANDDAATWGQVKNLINGKDFKESVVVSSTANINIAAPGATINGVALSSGDPVLLLGQTTPSQNGKWTWTAAGTPMTRPADWVTGEVSQGATVVALSGTSPGPSQWTVTTSGVITVDTTAVSLTETGAPGSIYTNGYGLLLSGGAFSVDPAHIPSKFSVDIGDGASTSIDVTHNLGTLDVAVTVRDKGNALQEVLVQNGPKSGTDANKVTIGPFPTAPTASQYRVTVIG